MPPVWRTTWEQYCPLAVPQGAHKTCSRGRRGAGKGYNNRPPFQGHPKSPMCRTQVPMACTQQQLEAIYRELGLKFGNEAKGCEGGERSRGMVSMAEVSMAEVLVAIRTYFSISSDEWSDGPL